MNFPKLVSLFYLAAIATANVGHAAGGYDQGTPAGQGEWDLDFTLNPGDKIEKGQTYLVWGYGLTDKLDFHGYASHETNGTNQVYAGLMYNFYSNEWLDLSTAIGFRERNKVTDIFLPQLLFTAKLPYDYDIIGSAVNVYNLEADFNRGVAYDIAVRIPIPDALTPAFLRAANPKLSLGAFNGVTTDKWYPTYSFDFEF